MGNVIHREVVTLTLFQCCLNCFIFLNCLFCYFSDLCIKDNGLNIVTNVLNKRDLHRYAYVSPSIILFNQSARYWHIYVCIHIN